MSNTQSADGTPQSVSLQPPGKGLPRVELFVARVLVGWRARRTSRKGAEQLFAAERERIRQLVDSLTDEQAAQRVLIPRTRGLEDSSRFWSVYMTLDHLRIINEGATALISALVRGKTPSRIVGTADVKPSPGADRTVIASFKEACDDFERTVESAADLKTKLRWPHPWFGLMNAARWHFITAFHMGLHRRQLEAIVAGRSDRPNGQWSVGGPR